MKKMAIVSFSLTGAALAGKLEEYYKEKGWQVESVTKSVYFPESLKIPLKEWTGRRFQDSEALVFVGACGIAVRSIAPFAASKKTDPAVLAADECGNYVISLLSGHLGGANALAKEAAAVLGAQPVITTATDLHRKFAVDVFAAKNQCSIFPMNAAKAFSAALLSGERVGFYSDFPWTGELPEGIEYVREKKSCGGPKIGMALTVYKECRPFEQTVFLVPKAVTAGIGCRKGKAESAVETLLAEALDQAGVWPQALKKAASIDLKAQEEGLLQWCRKRELPFETYSAQDLMAVPGEFSSSPFVQKVAGADNVCERSAVLAGKSDRFIQRKTAGDGVTCALVLSDWSVHFE